MYCIFYCKLQFSSLIIFCDCLVGFLLYHDKILVALTCALDVVGLFTVDNNNMFLYIMWSEFMIKNLF